MTNVSDKEIIESVRRGKIDDFRLIVNKYQKKMSNFMAKKIFDSEDIDDLIQETFFSFYKAIDRFDTKKPVLPYIYEIAKNQLKMYYRAKKSVLPLDEKIAAAPEREEVWPYYDVEKLLNKLTLQQKKALLLVSDGYSYEEIAKRLKKPINNVRTLIHRARLKINLLKNNV